MGAMVGIIVGMGVGMFGLVIFIFGISESWKNIADSIFCIASVLSVGFKLLDIFSETAAGGLIATAR